MYEYCELVVCIDQQGKKRKILVAGPIEKIDSITTDIESSQELRSYYADKIDIFKEKYGTYMNNLTIKNKKKETGDIALFTTINKEYARIKVLYKKHIEVFKKIIEDYEFQYYLRKNFYQEYTEIQRYNYELTRETSILIRKIYDIYKQYAKEEKKPSPTVLYSKIKKIPKYPLNNYQGIYDESRNDPTEPEQLEAYEIEDLEEKGKRYFKSL